MTEGSEHTLYRSLGSHAPFQHNMNTYVCVNGDYIEDSTAL